MKTFALCAICGGLAFVLVQYQITGKFLGVQWATTPPPPPPPPPPRLNFPEALAVVCCGTAVPQAAAFNKTAETHPAVVLKPNGTLHKWQDRLQPGWQAESVEETELVIILPPQVKTLIQT